MQDDKAKIQSELTKFFAGLDAGLTSLREVRSVYDEQVAFEFNSTRFFEPNENKTSDILKFFLDPEKPHGQKATFLKLFIQQFEIQVPLNLLEDIKSIRVIREDSTSEKRRIDISVNFGVFEYIIGIENKIGTASDGSDQLKAYVKELRDRTKDDMKWTLLYLTPDGENPTENSITSAHREELIQSKNLRIISYCKDIIDLFGKFEMACKAESVRAFLKDFRQYLKQEHIGETVMGESNFVADCLRDHPDMVKHIDALRNAVESLKQECFTTFWRKVADHLNTQNIRIQVQKMVWRDSGNSNTDVEHPDSPFKESGEVKRPHIFFEPNFQFPVYIAIGLSSNRKSLLSVPKDEVAKLEDRLKVKFPDVLGPPNLPWCAIVRLPHPELNSSDALCEFLKDKDRSKIRERAIEAAEKITKYINVTESLWREIQRQ